MEWQFLLGLSAITLFVIGLVIFFGLKLNKAVLKQAPAIPIPISITPAGTVLFASLVGFWIVCLTFRHLSPDSSFGILVGTTDGLLAAYLGSIVLGGIAGAILEKLGYPIARRKE